MDHLNDIASIVRAVSLALAANGTRALACTYSGSGDSGTVQGVSVPESLKGTIVHRFGDDGSKTEQSIEDAIQDATDIAVSELHGGYENGGGYGTFIVFSDRSAGLFHTDTSDGEGEKVARSWRLNATTNPDVSEEEQGAEVLLTRPTPLELSNVELVVSRRAVFAEMVYQIQSLLKSDDSITVAFSGSGDSGDNNEIVTNNEDLLALQVRIPGIEASYDATTKAWNHTTCWKTLSVSDAVNVLCDNVIKEAGFDGYENDAGGQGEITIERDVLRFEASHTVEEASPTATIFSLDEGDCEATVDVGADDDFTRYVMSEPVLQKEAA